MDWPAVRTSLELAASTSVTLLVLGAPLAWWLATSRSRVRPFVETVVSLPIVLPPTVLGFYLLLALGPSGFAGRAWHALGGGDLPFTFGGILIGSLLFNLPFAVRPFSAAFSALDTRYTEAAWCLGSSRLGAFFRVALPIASPGIVAGMILTFAHTLGEFGVVLMLGGNIPGVTRTLSIAVYDDVQSLDYGAAGRASLMLLGGSAVLVAGLNALQRKPLRR